MPISRRGLIGGAAALAGMGALRPLGPRDAHAAAVPADASTLTTGDKIAADLYRTLVPELFHEPAAAPAHSEVVVVGSGFGAAVAALRLVQSGTKVTMLERGNRWPRDRWRQIHSPEVAADGRALWHRRSLKGLSQITQNTPSFGGILDVTDYENLSVWRGAAVGGGSLVFTGVLLEPEQRHFERVFGGSLAYQEMHDQWYPKARTMLRASPMPKDVYDALSFGHSRRWDEAVRRAGLASKPLDGIWDWEVVRNEIHLTSRLSATVGESNYGNANGAKRDLTLGYLKEAEATGLLTIHHNHSVDRIAARDGGGYTLDLRVLAPTGETLSTRTVSTERLVLGAGSIGTTELLVRARSEGTLTRLDDSVGTGWGTNGDGGLVMSRVPSPGAVQGSPSASTILDESTGTPVRLENWYGVGFPLNVGIICSLGMVLDDTRGTFRFDEATDRVVLDWPADGNKAAEAAMRAVHDKIIAANDATPGLPLTGAPDVQTQFTAHPLGGAVLGRTLDGYGRVKGHPGLYVLDGAAIPGSTGTANPSLTITALAERNIAEIIRAKG